MRSERGRDANGRTDTDKRDLLKKRAQVLEIKEFPKKTQPTTLQSSTHTPSGAVTPQVAESTKPDEKKEAVHSQEREIWMGHDQVTVETAPRSPPIVKEEKTVAEKPVMKLNL